MYPSGNRPADGYGDAASPGSHGRPVFGGQQHAPGEWTAGLAGAPPDDATAAAAKTNNREFRIELVDDMLKQQPPPLPPPRFKDQMVQVPSPRLSGNTKRCVLTMDGYSYVIGKHFGFFLFSYSIRWKILLIDVQTSCFKFFNLYFIVLLCVLMLPTQ